MIDGRSPALEQHQSSIDHGRWLRVGQRWLQGWAAGVGCELMLRG
jgi:hypothetical protein